MFRNFQFQWIIVFLAVYYTGVHITCLPVDQQEESSTAQNINATSPNPSPSPSPSSQSKNHTKEGKTTAPLLFPSLDDKNSSVVVVKLNKSLTSLEEFNPPQSATDTEVGDLNQPPSIKKDTDDPEETTHSHEELAKMIFTNNTFGVHNKNIIAVTKSTDVDDVEPIQTGHNEDTLEAEKENTKQEVKEVPEETITNGSFDSLIGQGPEIIIDDIASGTGPNSSAGDSFPAIVAGIFVILCIVGYSAMLMWRRFLEQRYGNREMLVNEDFNDPNDMRHFSL